MQGRYMDVLLFFSILSPVQETRNIPRTVLSFDERKYVDSHSIRIFPLIL